MRVSVLLWFLLASVSVNAQMISPPDTREVFNPPANVSSPVTPSSVPQPIELLGPLETQEDIWKEAWPKESLPARLVRGIMRSRSLKNIHGKYEVVWRRCGERVPQDKLIEEAASWVTVLLSSLELIKQKTGVEINVWGAFATMANEGGFNECSLSYGSRKWAYKNGLTKKLEYSLSKDEVWNIIHSEKWEKDMKYSKSLKKADFGPWQIRHSIRLMTRSRFDAIMSKNPGIYLGVEEMADRVRDFRKKRRLDWDHPRPWMFWPGWNPYTPRAYDYDKKITVVARWLGAKREEIDWQVMNSQ